MKKLCCTLLLLAASLGFAQTNKIDINRQTKGNLEVDRAGVPPGGLTGYVLGKNSDADYDEVWMVVTGGTLSQIDWANVVNKPSVYPSDWSIIASKPNLFPPSPHTHRTASDILTGTITGGKCLRTSLDGLTIVEAANDCGTGSTGGGGSVVGVTGLPPVISSGGTNPVISMPQANSATDGFLSHLDFSTFQGKQDALPAASAAANGYLTSIDWSTFNAKQAALGAASASVNGYLLATDWSAFNAKQAALTFPLAASLTVSGVRTGSRCLHTSGDGTQITEAASDCGSGGGGGVTGVSASPPLASTGGTAPNVTITKATAAVDGYLAALDFVTFAAKLDPSSKGVANGVASLDAGAKVPAVQVPDLSATYVPQTQKGAPSGVASLDTGGKIPSTQLPDLSGSYVPLAQRAAANGVATLDATTKIPSAQIPDLSAAYIAVAQRAAANGVATLDASIKVPTAQIPDLSATYATVASLTTGLAGKANTSHTHTTADVISGIFAVGRIITGSATPSRCLHIDASGNISVAGSDCATSTGLIDPGLPGMLSRTGTNTVTPRTISASSTKLSVINGDGVLGNPSIDINEANLTLTATVATKAPIASPSFTGSGLMTGPFHITGDLTVDGLLNFGAPYMVDSSWPASVITAAAANRTRFGVDSDGTLKFSSNASAPVRVATLQTTGLMAPAVLGTGTASSATCLHGDSTYGTCGGGSTTHALLSATHTDTTPAAVVRGDLITGQGASALWARLAKGTAGQVLQMDGTGTDVIWGAAASGGGPHALLSATHTDTTPAAVVRGDLMTGQGATAAWARLGKGPAAATLQMDGTGTDVIWGKSYSVISEEAGANLTQRAKLTFFGPAITAADDAAGQRTTVTVQASGIGGCTNQFPRTLNDGAAPTCNSVTATDTDGTITKAAVVPNTAPADANILVASAGAYAPQAVSGDATLSTTGVVTLASKNKSRAKQIMLDTPATTDSGHIVVFDEPANVHIARAFCSTYAGTNVVVNLDKRTEALYSTDSGAHLLGADLTATTSGANTSTWSTTPCGGTASCGVPAHTLVVLTVTSVSGTPASLACSFDFTVD